MNNDDLIKRVNDIRVNIQNLKTSQTIGGDSWVVYRTYINMPVETANNNTVKPKYQIDFTPDIDGNFVAKSYKVTADRLAFAVDMTPDPNIPGRWFLDQGYFVAWGIMIYSTRKGTARVTLVP